MGEASRPSRLVYNIRSTEGINPGGKKYGGRNYWLNLEKAKCYCNIPQLLHVPCSHVITSWKCIGLDHESQKFMCYFYRMSNNLKVWESRFDPYIDPTQRAEYYGLDYVPDLDLLKTKKGKRKKQRLHGIMDACNRYGEDMYGFGDFDETTD